MANNASLNIPYIALSGAVIIAIAVVFAVIQPALASIQELNAEIEQNQNVLAQKRSFLSTVDAKKVQLQNNAIHEQRLSVILPKEDKYEDIIRVFSLASSDSGAVLVKMSDESRSAQSSINVERARGEAVNVPSSVKIAAVSVDAQGSYQQLRAFLTKLEKAPRLIDITAIKIQSGNIPDDLTLSIQASSYYISQIPSN